MKQSNEKKKGKNETVIRLLEGRMKGKMIRWVFGTTESEF